MVISARAVPGAVGAQQAPELLIRQAGRGDEQAFAELYDIVAGPVLGLVTRVIRDHAESETVAREVLLELWQEAPLFDQQNESVLAWALTIAHRRAVDRVRAAAGAEPDGQPELRWCFDEVVQTTLDRIEDDAVRRSLTELTDSQRRSLILAYYGGYSDREVSAVLDKPVGTIEARMRDGLLRLRESIGDPA
ncbi:sigma-70 family RNA polymerase sigma factor [Nocardia brasiliensis]|uniref:sigma-70 family RNA polymerase sigma factor n=1 Tax=Nocardia brasiliensis TaxID=37326 RepID=UPI001892DEBB|nr:sigma-70 family RNA polymerase sigma factor [Nocardia brasiliensis]MBF6126934.1 sigma-70 family RNA polymerase sigma factor [Nocardia brasiliensis]